MEVSPSLASSLEFIIFSYCTCDIWQPSEKNRQWNSVRLSGIGWHHHAMRRGYLRKAYVSCDQLNFPQNRYSGQTQANVLWLDRPETALWPREHRKFSPWLSELLNVKKKRITIFTSFIVRRHIESTISCELRILGVVEVRSRTWTWSQNRYP
jgi:hypothetical protein